MQPDMVGMLVYVIFLGVVALVIISSWLKDDLEKAIGSAIDVPDILIILQYLHTGQLLKYSFYSSSFSKKELEAQKKIKSILLSYNKRLVEWQRFEVDIINNLYKNQLFKNFDQKHNSGRWRREIEEKFYFLCNENIQEPILLSDKINLIDEGKTKKNWQEWIKTLSPPLLNTIHSIEEFKKTISPEEKGAEFEKIFYSIYNQQLNKTTNPKERLKLITEAKSVSEYKAVFSP